MSASSDQYGSTVHHLHHHLQSGGGLAFTGLDLGVLAIIAGILLATGVVLLFFTGADVE